MFSPVVCTKSSNKSKTRNTLAHHTTRPDPRLIKVHPSIYPRNAVHFTYFSSFPLGYVTTPSCCSLLEAPSYYKILQLDPARCFHIYFQTSREISQLKWPGPRCCWSVRQSRIWTSLNQLTALHVHEQRLARCWGIFYDRRCAFSGNIVCSEDFGE